VEIVIHPIGVAHTPIKTKEEAPIQGAHRPELTGVIEVDAAYAEGLQDIEQFSHLILLYYFDRAGEVELLRTPFLDDNPHGIFACRHPCRPNGIGITVVKLLERSGNKLVVAGVDVLDGTPVIDIKPYVPSFDCYPDASEGWLEGKKGRGKPAGRE